MEKKTPISVDIEVDTTQIEKAIQKTDWLIELLEKANELICSLGRGSKSDFKGIVNGIPDAIADAIEIVQT